MSARMKRSVAAALAVLVLAGCGPTADSPRGPADPMADTAGPRALLASWHASLAAGDKTPYLGCFVGSKDELVLALAAFEVVQASYAFHNAVVAAYGPEGWKAFEESDGIRVGLLPRDPAWAQTITVMRMGPAAFGYLPRGRVPLAMSEAGGRWRLHASGLVPPGLEARRAADYLFRWAATLRELVPGIGDGQIKADRARRDVSERFQSRVAPAEQPAAAEAVDYFMMY